METKTKISLESPLKLMMKDIRRILCSNSNDFPWKICLPNDRIGCIEVKFGQVWLQGYIKSVDSAVDTLTMSDGTGYVRVIKCARVPGTDRSWITPGLYCGLMAVPCESTAAATSVLSAVKLMDLPDKAYAEEMWPLEVEELANFLMDKIVPNLQRQG